MKNLTNRIVAGLSAAAMTASMLSFVSFAEEVEEEQSAVVFGAKVFAIDNRLWRWSSVNEADYDRDLSLSVSGNAGDIISGTRSRGSSDVGAAGVQIFIANTDELLVGTKVTCKVEMTLHGEKNSFFKSKTLDLDLETDLDDPGTGMRYAVFSDIWLASGSDWTKFEELGDFTLDLTFSDVEITEPEPVDPGPDENAVKGLYVREDADGGGEYEGDYEAVGDTYLFDMVEDANIEGNAVKMTIDYEILDNYSTHSFAPVEMNIGAALGDEREFAGQLNGIKRSENEDGSDEQYREAIDNGGILLKHDGYIMVFESGSVTLYVDYELAHELLDRAKEDENDDCPYLHLGISPYGVQITNVTYEYAQKSEYDRAYTVLDGNYENEWSSMGEWFGEFMNINKDDGMRITIDYSLADSLAGTHRFSLIDMHTWDNLNSRDKYPFAFSGVHYGGTPWDHWVDEEGLPDDSEPVLDYSGYIVVKQPGTVTLNLDRQGIEYIEELVDMYRDERGSKWYGIGFQTCGVSIDKVTYEYNVSEPEPEPRYVSDYDVCRTITNDRYVGEWNLDGVLPVDLNDVAAEDGIKITVDYTPVDLEFGYNSLMLTDLFDWAPVGKPGTYITGLEYGDPDDWVGTMNSLGYVLHDEDGSLTVAEPGRVEMTLTKEGIEELIRKSEEDPGNQTGLAIKVFHTLINKVTYEYNSKSANRVGAELSKNKPITVVPTADPKHYDTVSFRLHGMTADEKGTDEGSFWNNSSCYAVDVKHKDGSHDYYAVGGPDVYFDYIVTNADGDEVVLTAAEMLRTLDDGFGSMFIQLPYIKGDTYTFITNDWSEFPKRPVCYARYRFLHKEAAH